MKPASKDDVKSVRAFNRFWTKQIGVLGAGLLETSYSLTEARVLYELAQRELTESGDLRTELGLDAGYLSRILARFKAGKLIATEASPTDARRQVVRLTSKGQKVFSSLDGRSAAEASAMLQKLSVEERRKLVAAMGSIERILAPAPKSPACVLRGLEPGDLGWVVERHGALYAEEHGWDEGFEALVARIVADYVDKRDARKDNAWIAEVDGERVGCVFCVKKDTSTAQLRLLLMEPRTRGLGVGSRLVDECVRFARRAGYAQIVLWTNNPLTAARRIYERAGFRLIEEDKHRSFGHDLVGQRFALSLKAAPRASRADSRGA